MELVEYTPNNRARLVDKNTGIQVVKGGIRNDAGFIDSVMSAYTNLVNMPLVLILGTLLTFVFLTENNANGPLEEIRNLLTGIEKSTDIKFEKAFAGLLLRIFNFLIKYKFQFIALGFAWLPYIAKPSRNSLYISIIHSFMIFLLRSWPTLSFIIIAHAHFLFVSVRKPVYKMFIILALIVYLFIAIEVEGKPVTSKSTRSLDGTYTYEKISPDGNREYEFPANKPSIDTTSGPVTTDSIVGRPLTTPSPYPRTADRVKPRLPTPSEMTIMEEKAKKLTEKQLVRPV